MTHCAGDARHMAQFECRSGQSGTQRQCALLAALPLPLTRLVAARAPSRAPRHAIGAGASSACARTRRQRLRAGLAEDSCLCPGRAGACTAVRTCIGMVMANCEWGRRHRRRRLPPSPPAASLCGRQHAELQAPPRSSHGHPPVSESLSSEQPGPGTAPSPIPAWHPTDSPSARTAWPSQPSHKHPQPGELRVPLLGARRPPLLGLAGPCGHQHPCPAPGQPGAGHAERPAARGEVRCPAALTALTPALAAALAGGAQTAALIRPASQRTLPALSFPQGWRATGATWPSGC